MDLLYPGFVVSMIGFWFAFFSVGRFKWWIAGGLVILGMAMASFGRMEQVMEYLPFLLSAGLCHIGIVLVGSDWRKSGFSLLSVAFILMFYFK